MDYTRQTIINGETVIDKELLDAMQDGIEEGIRKAEEALEKPESDPNVPEWAKSKTKPAYTAEEVGAAPLNHTHQAPDFIVAEAERVAKNVQATRTAKSLVFPVMSDMHLFAGNSGHDASLVSAQYAGMGVAELQKRIHLDFVGYLGDYSFMDANGNYTVEQVKADITAFKKTTDTTGKEIWCVGNHDLNYGKTSDRLMTLDELYSHIGANSDGVKPYGNIERGYGYVDFENQKIRVIYLNTCDASDWIANEGENAQSEWISPTQIQWLADDALDFTDKTAPTEWGIVIIGHHPLHYSYGCFKQVLQLLEAYKDGLSGSISCTIRTETVDGQTTYPQQRVDYDFSSVERAEIICNIHGHNHNCGYSKISSTTMNESTEVAPWLWRFCIPNLCVGRYNESATSTIEKIKNLYGEFDKNGNPVYWRKETGTAKATSFCIVNIDRKNKKIFAHTFGAGIDRAVSYGEEVIPYTNQIPISTDTDGTIYNGTGYKENSYLSSGNIGTRDGINCTGFIPIGCGVPFTNESGASHGSITALGQQIIRLKNIEADLTNQSVRISFYDANKVHIATVAAYSWKPLSDPQDASLYYILGADGYPEYIDVSVYTAFCNQSDVLNKETAYFRLCSPGIDGDSIITVNEEIV